MVESYWSLDHCYWDSYWKKPTTDITSKMGPFIYQAVWSWVDIVGDDNSQDGFELYFQMRWLNPPDIMDSFYAELDRRDGAISEEQYDAIIREGSRARANHERLSRRFSQHS